MLPYKKSSLNLQQNETVVINFSDGRNEGRKLVNAINHGNEKNGLDVEIEREELPTDLSNSNSNSSAMSMDASLRVPSSSSDRLGSRICPADRRVHMCNDERFVHSVHSYGNNSNNRNDQSSLTLFQLEPLFYQQMQNSTPQTFYYQPPVAAWLFTMGSNPFHYS